MKKSVTFLIGGHAKAFLINQQHCCSSSPSFACTFCRSAVCFAEARFLLVPFWQPPSDMQQCKEIRLPPYTTRRGGHAARQHHQQFTCFAQGSTFVQQCLSIWVPSSTKAPEECSSFNPKCMLPRDTFLPRHCLGS